MYGNAWLIFPQQPLTEKQVWDLLLMAKDISLVANTEVYIILVIQPILGNIILPQTYGTSGQTFQELVVYPRIAFTDDTRAMWV
jgi:hypothetical protein